MLCNDHGTRATITMHAILLTIGDELLIGQVIDSNAAWLGEQLTLLGVDLRRVITVGDDRANLQREIGQALDEADLVVTTGGLGPTPDDLTRDALARLFQVELEYRAEILEEIERRFSRRGRCMPASNRVQAMVPAGFTVLPNPVGTAPGLWRVTERGSMLAVLPGVPYEMQRLFLDEVRLRVADRIRGSAIVHRTLRTTGIGESSLQELLGDLSGHLLDGLRLAYLPSTDGVRLRLRASGETMERVRARLDHLEEHLRGRLGDHLYGTEEETLEAVVGAMMLERSLTVAVAESCTGGYVAHRLTNVPGSSAYFVGGVVAYSNQVKTHVLGVDPEVLRAEGAVSKAVARQMAVGIRGHLGTDIGLSTTGVAGPGGGTPDKPVGTVWIGYADESREEARLLRLGEDRMRNKERTATAVLGRLRRMLLAWAPAGRSGGRWLP